MQTTWKPWTKWTWQASTPEQQSRKSGASWRKKKIFRRVQENQKKNKKGGRKQQLQPLRPPQSVGDFYLKESTRDSLLSQAESTTVGYPEIAQQYLAATGDSDGVKTENGALVLQCWQETPQKMCAAWVKTEWRHVFENKQCTVERCQAKNSLEKSSLALGAILSRALERGAV